MSAGNMIFMRPNELVAHIKKNTRLLGIDLGSKTIGIAVSDPFLKIASPITTLIRLKLSKNSIELDKVVKEYAVGGLIVGLPINMDGTEGPRAQATRDWTLDLIKALQLPAAFWDERLSTVAVEKVMLRADMTRKREQIK